MKKYLGYLLTSFCLVFPSLAFGDAVSAYLNGPAIVTPPGNIGGSVKRSTSMSKYRDILEQLTEENYGCVIRQAAEIYQVDPVAVMGSIIGEHTYNVDNWDLWGERYVYMRKKWLRRFESDGGLDLIGLLSESGYNSCPNITDNNYDLWTCYNSYWKNDRRNARRNRGFWELKWTFFNPMGSGYTYGLGQLGPERALQLSDMVHYLSGFELLSLNDPEKIYDHILNPQISIHYVAASNRKAIDLYRDRANFDISQNMGVIATLYNLGREAQKAEEKYQSTVERLQQGKSIELPRSNYYGWLINEQEQDIRNHYDQKIRNLSAATCAPHLL